MIISRIIGGLGNQMFQYAAGRRLAHVHETKLKLDLSEFSHYKLYGYELSRFSIAASPASEEELAPFKQSPRLTDRLPLLSSKKPLGYIKETHFHFDPTLLSAPDHSYLDGYWQSEKYFLDIKPLLQVEFSLKAKPNLKNAAILSRLKQSNSVVMHIRRGDYVTNRLVNRHHPVCSIDYYQSAVSYLSQKVADPIFFIFSDDPEWVKENIRLEFPTEYISHNHLAPTEDMRLMQNGKYFIIANSTFSWWGAWLAAHPKKIVIAPKDWFKGRGKDDRDLIPSSWHRL